MSDILVKPPQLLNSASIMHQSANTIQACVDAIDQQIQALGPSRFQGVSADVFRATYAKLRERVYSFKPTVDAFAGELEAAAARFQAADKALGQ